MLAVVRRLVPLVSIVVFTDALLFAALIPLLPAYADEFDLSKLGAGVLLGAYGAGAVVGGVPGGLMAARIGPKRTVLAGLLVLAVASVAFALAGGVVTLGLSRFAQGLASAITWGGALTWIAVAAPRGRRGQTLGTVFGFAVLGFITGPIVGAAAELTSIRGAFLGVAAITTLLAVVAATHPAAPREPRQEGAVRSVLADRAFVGGLWLTMLPAFFFGVLDVLAPLALDDAGWTAVAIAAVFVTAGLIEVVMNPFLGRVSDRRGRLYPIRLALFGSIAVATALAFASEPYLVAALALAAALAFGGFYTPSMALVSDRAERHGLPQGLGFGVMNSAWATGAMVGPALGGALAHGLGDAAPYLLCSGLCTLTLASLVRARERGSGGNRSSTQAASSGRSR